MIRSWCGLLLAICAVCVTVGFETTPHAVLAAGFLAVDDLMCRLMSTANVPGVVLALIKDGKIVLTDEKGGMATVTIADVIQSNGVIQVIDTVLMPN